MKQKVRKVALLSVTAFVIVLQAANAQYYRGGYAHRGFLRGYAAPYYSAPMGYRPYYSYLPHSAISITFGGYPYYYTNGLFYRPYNGFYRPVFPPIGIHVGILPFGYIPITVGPNPYYFYEGTYYRRYDDKSYEVVDAPIGAQLSALPRGAKAVTVNGEKFYELNGTYYKEEVDSKGRTFYTVTGKNGNINNSDNVPTQPAPAPNDNRLHVGDKVSQVPENSKVVTINGKRTFVSPDHVYYQQDDQGGYTIVGVEEN